MASPLGHALFGVSISVATASITGIPTSTGLMVGAVVASCLPDLDMIGLLFGFNLWHVHRRATHSLPVLIVTALIAMYLCHLLRIEIEWRAWVIWTAALLSHPLLDVITTGAKDAAAGFGIPLFWPFGSRRWFVQRPLFRSAPLVAYRSPRKLALSLLPELCWLGSVAICLVIITH